MTPPTEGGDVNWNEEAKAHYDLEALRDVYFALEAEADRLRAEVKAWREWFAASCDPSHHPTEVEP